MTFPWLRTSPRLRWRCVISEELCLFIYSIDYSIYTRDARWLDPLAPRHRRLPRNGRCGARRARIGRRLSQ